jgi:tetratricopeptide (TPR) repeat protein
MEYLLGHDQAAYDNEVAEVQDWRTVAVADLGLVTANNTPLFYAGRLYNSQGNFRRSDAKFDQFLAAGAWGTDDDVDAIIYRVIDLSSDHDLAAARQVAREIPVTLKDGTPNPEAAEVQFVIGGSSTDWAAFAAIVRPFVAQPPSDPTSAATLSIFVYPHLAYAMARTGDVAGAEALIAKTPLDCDTCVRMRGRIEAVKGNWEAADQWFAMVVQRSPSIPFADTDWGEALLTKGDIDGAEAKFAIAHGKSPHFADPVELWGEALMRQGDYNGAAAKFADAAKDAPRWGRLHMMWGEVLAKLAQADEARAQWRAAAGMDLSQDDRAALAKLH